MALWMGLGKPVKACEAIDEATPLAMSGPTCAGGATMRGRCARTQPRQRRLPPVSRFRHTATRSTISDFFGRPLPDFAVCGRYSPRSGHGGDALVSNAAGLSRPTTIRARRRERESGDIEPGRVHRPGAGRPRIEQSQPDIIEALEKLVDPMTRGDPQSPLRWTCKSRAKLTTALSQAGWKVSSTTVGRLLHELGHSLQSVRKSREGAAHPDRNAQFEHINAKADECLQHAQPVVSVDTKKKELVGDFSIGNTRTDAGLRVKAKFDKRKYPTGEKVTKEEMDVLSLHRNEFCGD